ncbi:unnamed protein product [Spirodela intermedia]|uniref:Uncharacterized protein n=1 Tax=Spirodela intermedia TaxID=51605 RepID=A0A7I8IEF7_SPIIN|nr:unnamed protein product [Spirodela intermedia]CAA6656177.1 unnamed protein product [Spirodela intermedia]
MSVPPSAHAPNQMNRKENLQNAPLTSSPAHAGGSPAQPRCWSRSPLSSIG